MLDPRPSSEPASVIVLGGGIAGLVAADRLSAAGLNVTVIDRSPTCGGAHQSRQIGDYTFDLGSFFYERRARIFELAPEIRQQCPQVQRFQRRIAPDGGILHYPLDPRELLRQSPWRLPQALLDLAGSRLVARRDGTLSAICRQRLGRTFFRTTGLESYINRFHHVPPNEIDEEFFYRRMAHIERSTRPGALFRAIFRSVRSAPPAPRAPLYVRPQAGFEAMFAPIFARLSARGVRFLLRHELERVRRDGSIFHVGTNRGSFIADAIVSTVPLDTVHKAIFGGSSGLLSLDMTTLFVSAEWLDQRAGNVLFNFHSQGAWKRLTVYSRIYPTTAGGREYFTVEATVAPGAAHDPDASFEDFRTHATRLGLARGLRLEGQERVDACYPLYAPGASASVRSVLDRIAATGIVAAGRQGRFEYLPTSSGVVRRVEQELAASGLLHTATELAA